MKVKILIIAGLLFGLMACNREKVSDAYYGKWDLLTIENGDTILWDTEYPHPTITYTKDSLVNFMGSEESRCKIVSSFVKDDKTYLVLERGCWYRDTISYEIINSNLVKWNLEEDQSGLYTNRPANYHTVQQELKQDFDETPWHGHFRVDAGWESQSLYITIQDFDHITVDFNRNGKETIRQVKATWVAENKIEIKYNNEQTLFIEKTGDKYYLTGNVFAFDPNCRELLLVKDEETSEGDTFVKETDWVGVTCKQYQEDEGYTNIQECTFPNANLQQVYAIVKKTDKFLKAELPAKDLEYTADGGNVAIIYRYKTKKELYIELGYPGGVTTIEINEKENNTQSKITFSAD